jgi:hypothetical protein
MQANLRVIKVQMEVSTKPAKDEVSLGTERKKIFKVAGMGKGVSGGRGGRRQIYTLSQKKKKRGNWLASSGLKVSGVTQTSGSWGHLN